MKTLGADILRLWICSTDYRNEMSLSDEILKRVSDAYRRIRNTARFLLGNLRRFRSDQAPGRRWSRCLLLDQWAVQQAYDVQQAVVAAYARYDFPEIVQRVQNFCTNETRVRCISTSPRIACTRCRRTATVAAARRVRCTASSRRWCAGWRRSLTFTAEEIWADTCRARAARSVLFETWYGGLAALQGSPEQRAFWSDLLAIREAASRVLEGMRGNADRRVARSRSDALSSIRRSCRDMRRRTADELRFFFITSSLTLGAGSVAQPADAAPIDAERSADVCVSVTVRKMPIKCIRCWHHRPDVGIARRASGDLRDAASSNVEGPGEDRRWF